MSRKDAENRVVGTIANALAILICGFVGLWIGRGIPDKMNQTILSALGILLIAIGGQYTFKAENLALIGLALAVGAAIGEWGEWDAKLERMGLWLQQRFARNAGGFVQGFVYATLVFCVGAMGILGSLEEGVTGNAQILFLKSVLDGIFSLVFAASLGLGVLFSAVPVFLYQGSLTLFADFLRPLMTEGLMNNITALGGVLIAGIGFNLLKLTEIRIANLLPGILLVPLFMWVVSFF